MNNKFIISDTHFGDERIIKYENRPFNNVTHMDMTIAVNWNKTVGKHDKIFVLGDFADYDIGYVKKILLPQLYGYKILVMGNHDRKYDVKEWLDAGLDEVYNYPIIVDDFYILSHEPLYVNQNMPYANICSHVHNNSAHKDFSKQSFCVSVERIEYKPVSFEYIKHMMIAEQVLGSDCHKCKKFHCWQCKRSDKCDKDNKGLLICEDFIMNDEDFACY